MILGLFGYYPWCCTPKFSLSFLKESPWILKFSLIQFQALNYQFFQANHSQGQNGHLHAEKSNFDFWTKTKFQESYFIKTCWNMKFVSSKSSKVKFTMEKPNF